MKFSCFDSFGGINCTAVHQPNCWPYQCSYINIFNQTNQVKHTNKPKKAFSILVNQPSSVHPLYHGVPWSDTSETEFSSSRSVGKPAEVWETSCTHTARPFVFTHTWKNTCMKCANLKCIQLCQENLRELRVQKEDKVVRESHFSELKAQVTLTPIYANKRVSSVIAPEKTKIWTQTTEKVTDELIE